MRSFFSNLYASSTNRLAAVLTATTANRKMQKTINPGVIRFPPSLVDVAEITEVTVEKLSEALLSAVGYILATVATGTSSLLFYRRLKHAKCHTKSPIASCSLELPLINIVHLEIAGIITNITLPVFRKRLKMFLF